MNENSEKDYKNEKKEVERGDCGRARARARKRERERERRGQRERERE